MPHLPEELIDEIWRHACASRIQDAWRRHERFGYATRGAWPSVLQHLTRTTSHAKLSVLRGAHSVRREWRREPESWLFTTSTDVDAIVDEIAQGYWDVKKSC